MQYCLQNKPSSRCIGKVEVAARRARFTVKGVRWIDLCCPIECHSTATVNTKGLRPWYLETCLVTLVAMLLLRVSIVVKLVIMLGSALTINVDLVVKNVVDMCNVVVSRNVVLVVQNMCTTCSKLLPRLSLFTLLHLSKDQSSQKTDFG
jgi:hypothetical protein